MSDVEKLVKKVKMGYMSENDYGCNEYDDVLGLDSQGAPYYLPWMIVEGTKYYLVEISVDVDPGNDRLGWLPVDFVPDIGEILVLSSDRAVRFSFFDKWSKQEAVEMAYDDSFKGPQLVAETRKLIRR